MQRLLVDELVSIGGGCHCHYRPELACRIVDVKSKNFSEETKCAKWCCIDNAGIAYLYVGKDSSEEEEGEYKLCGKYLDERCFEVNSGDIN